VVIDVLFDPRSLAMIITVVTVPMVISTPVFWAALVAYLMRIPLAHYPPIVVPSRRFITPVVVHIILVSSAIIISPCPCVAPKYQRKSDQCDYCD
jgi:hypothetical protein